MGNLTTSGESRVNNFRMRLSYYVKARGNMIFTHNCLPCTVEVIKNRRTGYTWVQNGDVIYVPGTSWKHKNYIHTLGASPKYSRVIENHGTG